MQDAPVRASVAIALAVWACAFLLAPPPAHTAEVPAARPPMGWNSWDAYGESVSEADLRSSAKWMADNLKPFGWQYVVVDSGWYVTNHGVGTNARSAEFSLDAFGRYTPAVGTIPSAGQGAGFRPLARYVHSLGLKFGIHVLRGVPRKAVQENLPIAGSGYHAADAANAADTCPWNPFNYGLDASKAAAQAYYDSVARLYAEWEVDLVKVDCIADHPYKGDEIRMLSRALRQTGRPIVLSLSPGPTSLDKAAEVGRYANMWRISDDVWDVWYSDKDFPQGPGNQFARAAKWARYSQPGNWPDADMLPIGSLRPSAGWGAPRESRLTRDEQRTLVTLWCVFRSPLIMGGNLLALDDDPWTKSLLTNPEVIAVDQHSRMSRAVVNDEETAVWSSQPESGDGYYLALFNLGDRPRTLRYLWKDLGLPAARYRLRDLWERGDLAAADSLVVSLSPHASVLYRVSEPR